MPHRILTTDEISAILESRDLSELIGAVETISFEAKEKRAYPDDHIGRFELAKDISAFANAVGGYLVIGLKTVPLASERTDVVSALDLVANGELPLSKYLGIVREYVFPPPDGLDCRWMEDRSGNGVCLLYVPQQSEEKGPFLVNQTYVEGTKLKGTIFGLFRRHESDAMPLAIEQLQRALRNGMNPLGRRMERMESKLDSLMEKLEPVAPAPTQAVDLAQLDARVRDIIDE